MNVSNIKKRAVSFAAAGFCIAMLASCSGMDNTQQRTLSGAAIGTGVGAAAAGLTGGAIGTGALIGAGAGAVGGYVYDQHEKSEGK